MDPELRRMIEETRALARDNHRLLRTIRRHQILSSYGKIILWIILILATVVSYTEFLKPYVDTLQLSSLSGVPTGVFNAPTTTPLGKLINSLKAGN